MDQYIWSTIVREAKKLVKQEPALVSFVHETIINQSGFKNALSFHLASKFQGPALSAISYTHLFLDVMSSETSILEAAVADLKAIRERDAATKSYLLPFLYFKGFHALQASRIAHFLWKEGREAMAHHLQSRNSELFAVDIHPAAKIGKGILLDHATSFVCGETAVVGDNVSILHEVTLGGSGKECGDRHPKVSNGVLIGSGAKLLGNIKIGEGAKIGAGSVVLDNVPGHTTYVGVPAKPAGKPAHKSPAKFMDQKIG